MSASARAYAAGRVVTCDPSRAAPGDALGVVEHAAVIVEGGRVTWIGPAAELPAGVPVTEAKDRVLTPGLVDAHTHACWAGSRHAEYAARMSGGDYRAIAAAGGGILSTHRAVAAASEDALAVELSGRLLRMARLGVTLVEVKSGYGLLPEHETKQLQAMARAACAPGMPAVIPTLLALHALPPGAERRGFVARAASELVPEVARARLARFVDAYVDQNAFSAEEAREIGRAAAAHGLGIRLHVGQFADVGGAELAAELGARSVDHLEHVSDAAIARLAEAGVTAVLLPVASFTLGQAPPPVAKLRAAGVPLVVASDANPGTAPTESLPLALALGVRAYRLTPDEALLGATRVAAHSLGEDERGVLRVGARADLVIWDHSHEHEIVQPWGVARARLVVRDGEVIVSKR